MRLSIPTTVAETFEYLQIYHLKLQTAVLRKYLCQMRLALAFCVRKSTGLGGEGQGYGPCIEGREHAPNAVW
jgi:hypothetical protein